MRIEKIGIPAKTKYVSNNQIAYKANYIPLKNLTKMKGYKITANQSFWKDLHDKFPKALDEDISIVYHACLEPNGCVNESATNTLYDLFHINSTLNVIRKTKNRLSVINWFLNPFKTRDKETLDKLAADTARYNRDLNYWTSSFINTSFNACRDKNGYLNSQNLKILKEFYNAPIGINELLFPSYLEACKDENGIFTNENIEFLKKAYTYYKPDYVLSSIIGGIKDKPISISKEARKLVLENEQYFKDEKSVGITNFIDTFLHLTKGENRDEILKKVRENLKYLIKGNDVKYSFADISGVSNDLTGKRNRNFDYIIEIVKNEKDTEKPLNTWIVMDNNKVITEKNMKEYRRLHKALGDNEKINSFYATQGFKDDNGLINSRFVDEIEKTPDAKAEEIRKRLGYKTWQEIISDTKDKNLYKAEEMLALLKTLKQNYTLKPFVLDAKTDNYGRLLFIFPDVVKDERNPQAYNKMVDILKSVDGIYYNQKDENGISFLEKVINSENIMLLDLIKSKSDEFKYDPMLEFAYKGIQNEEFKNALVGINLDFEELRHSAEIGSIRAFHKIKNQIESPFCDKEKTLRQLYNIAKANRKDDFMAHLEVNYPEILNK